MQYSVDRLYQIFKSSTGISTDTRNIRKGSVFFALKGANFNGNTFAEEALKQGACLAIIDEQEYNSENTMLVPNALEAMQSLASYHRKKLNIPVIALTGSNGKTTTKELIHAALSAEFNVLATKGNLNNHIGVPLTLLAINDTHDIAIIEMGANHQKEIEFLSSLAQPDIGYITNFGKAHMEGFGGVEGIIKGKSELYDYLRENEKKVLLNHNDSTQLKQSKGMQAISFGYKEQVDYLFKPLELNSKNHVGVYYKGEYIRTQLSGIYNVSNLMAAVTLALHYEVSFQKAKEKLEAYVPQNNRSQLHKTTRNLLMLDAYNANPSSMKVALDNFEALKAQNKWVILGDMFELGDASSQEHQAIVQQAVEKNFEQIVLVGEAFMATTRPPAVLSFSKTDEALLFLEEKKLGGKTILIKGSRGMQLEKLVPSL
jgi:UDP-N-acetylmuramoyl-tripeptide--D-alanyl-D-alanine ligase